MLQLQRFVDFPIVNKTFLGIPLLATASLKTDNKETKLSL